MASNQSTDLALSPEESDTPAEREINQTRFSTELEFVSALSSPAYLADLAHRGVLADYRFVRYLHYLSQHWPTPEYARFVRYPAGLTMLNHLLDPEFRGAVGQEGWEEMARNKMIGHWATWRTASAS
ncbi:Mediator of RNA polymerase II transcription subunit 31 [Tilletia horrida]|nr:Mediator of RNA polymerase II transcription subunit 31 [Tilletia horrida]KAK0568990.1 Mediator of RNA polymerase II transcription subunit 31 [Tilletia horrida]